MENNNNICESSSNSNNSSNDNICINCKKCSKKKVMKVLKDLKCIKCDISIDKIIGTSKICKTCHAKKSKEYFINKIMPTKTYIRKPVYDKLYINEEGKEKSYYGFRSLFDLNARRRDFFLF